MNPILVFRMEARSLWDAEPKSIPRTLTLPFVGESSPPIIFNKVVFPEPDGPTNPVNSAFSNSRLMSLNAVK